MKHFTMVVVFLVAACHSALGQRFPDRWLTINPLMNNPHPMEPGAWSWMHSSGGWAEFGAYRILRDHEHAWVQRLGSFLELFRIGNEASLAVLGNIEFIANPDNDIRFNPRAVFWEEGFLYTQRTGSAFWQIGYYHRCKHDVDNLILKRERSLIFGSLLGKYLIPFSLENGQTEALATVRADIYTIRQDDRVPSAFSDQTPHVKRLLGTVGGVLHIRRSLLTKPFGLFATYWGALNLYGLKEGVLPKLDRVHMSTFQGGLAAGIAIEGNAHFRVGFTYEYLSDTGINPFPEHAHLITLGVTIVNPSAMW